MDEPWSTGDTALVGVGVLAALGLGYALLHQKYHNLEYDSLRTIIDASSVASNSSVPGRAQKFELAYRDLMLGLPPEVREQIRRFILLPYDRRWAIQHGLDADAVGFLGA